MTAMPLVVTCDAARAWSHVLCCAHAEPEEEEQVAAKQATQEKQEAEQQTNGGGSQESMQIEEVSQAGTETSTEQEGSGGVVQSVVGAARSLFGAGKADQQVCLMS